MPVALNVASNATCSAVGSTQIDADLDVAFSADLAASACVQAEGVRARQWQPHAAGSASVDFKLNDADAWFGGISCQVPRFDFETLVIGTAGPYVGVAPNLGTTPDGETLSAELSAGLESGLFGRDASMEATLIDWKP